MDLGIFGVTPVAAALLVGFVTGFVEMAKAFFDGDIRKGVIILVAAVAGGVVAPFIDVSIIAGIVSGFAASGAVTLAQHLGKN